MAAPNNAASFPSSGATSTDVSPAFFKFEDPNIDYDLTPLTSAHASPEPESKPLELDGTDLEKLQAIVRESCEGRSSKVETWAHRGLSADWPENTMASFRATCRAGSQGIETDIHITSDNHLVMFHDPELSRKTNGFGKIHETPWEGVLEHVRTKGLPAQPLPRFAEVLELLMEPENIHVKLNIDCKVENIPEKLFPVIKSEIQRCQHWETLLAPRINLGIWHPKFITQAKIHLPFIPLYAICMSIPTVRSFFFAHCDGYSICFPALYCAEGKKFRDEARKAGKRLTVWTVNDKDEMLECLRWGVKAVITDKPEQLLQLQDQIERDPSALLAPYFKKVLMPWSSSRYYAFNHKAEANEEMEYLEREGGRFSAIDDLERQ